jgi:hypothetical protein
MTDEKDKIGMILKMLLKWIQASITKMEMDQKWHEEILGIFSAEMDEDESWSDDFQGEWA